MTPVYQSTRQSPIAFAAAFSVFVAAAVSPDSAWARTSRSFTSTLCSGADRSAEMTLGASPPRVARKPADASVGSTRGNGRAATTLGPSRAVAMVDDDAVEVAPK